MEKTQKNSTQIYGYTVCVVAVITFLIATVRLVPSAMDLGNPLQGGYPMFGAPSLASFENYKMDLLKSPQRPGEEAKTATYVPDDETIRAMYEAAKAERIQSVRHQSSRSLVTSSLVILISIVLFVAHWRLARKSVKLEMA